MRPAVSVILPFHGSAGEARQAEDALLAITTRPGDELVIVDNSGVGIVPGRDGIRIVTASDEHSAYYARNVGCATVDNEWLLFVDADCQPAADILDRYFAEPIGEGIGAVVGEVVGMAEQQELVARFARARGHLGQHAHWTFPFRPWGVTANLLVRRAAWASVGGFHEGIRSGGDTEFSWRIQDAGWTLDYRPEAVVEHRHRDSIRTLFRQGARYGAGRAWVMRRYPGSLPKPPLVRPVGRSLVGIAVWTLTGRFERAVFKALDAVFVTGEWYAFRLSNTPPVRRAVDGHGALWLVAGAFPAQDDPAAVQAARALGGAPIEAAARPIRVDRAAARSLPITWAEDDGTWRRLAAVGWLLRVHPSSTIRYVRERRPLGLPPLHDVAARARRLSAARQIRSIGDPRAAAAITRLLGLG